MLDGYVVLTRQMAEVVSGRGKPCLVMEGLVDVENAPQGGQMPQKSAHPTVLYAGALRKEYGLETLVRGFQAWDEPRAELVVYGQGAYAAELAAIADADHRITYRGTAPLAHIIEAERRAWLLVNPRQPDQEFTKYSFPSKNMEYLASGTAVLTTRLPGMPSEYLEYVLTIDEVGVAGVTRGLERAFSEGADKLAARGARGRRFVLERKNNVVQAGRILELAMSIER
jgi:glycosyltransferase involved in cell wall biosynthesis